MYDDIGFGFEINSGAIERTKKFSIHLFGNIISKAVAYNATLQGGMFNRSSVYTLSGDQLDRVVLNAEGGIVFAFGKADFEYSNSYTTSEFDKAFDHGWGHLSVLIKF